VINPFTPLTSHHVPYRRTVLLANGSSNFFFFIGSISSRISKDYSDTILVPLVHLCELYLRTILSTEQQLLGKLKINYKNDDKR